MPGPDAILYTAAVPESGRNQEKAPGFLPLFRYWLGEIPDLFFKDLGEIGGTAKAGLLRDLCDGKIFFPATEEDSVPPVIQKIIKQRKLHMFPEKAAIRFC